MSLFHSLNTPPKVRRQLFWIVCIWVRLIIAAVSSAVVYQGSETVGVGVGTVVAVLGLFFWYRRCTDDKDNIWWYRSLHGLIWVGVGVTTAAVAGTEHNTSVAGIIIGVGLGIDVLVGILTATAILPKRNNGPGWINDGDRRGRPGWINDGLFPVFFQSGWKIIGNGPTVNAVVTPWTLVHIGFGSLFGFLVSLAGTDTRPIWGLVATAVLFLWEGIENAKPEVVKSFSFRIVRAIGLGSCLGDPNQNEELQTSLTELELPGPGHDSPLNSAADIVFGAVALWLLAYRDNL